MITIRKLIKEDNFFLNTLISSEGINYQEFLKLGWTGDEIIKQFKKNINLSFGAFYKNSLISFIIGDLYDIENISEYEILLLYVCKKFRNKGIGTKILKKIEENSGNLSKIYLEVSKNNIDGILYYNNMDFKKTYIRKNYYKLKNKRIDAILMSKIY